MEMNRRLSPSWTPCEMNPRYWPRTQEKEVKASEGHEWPICLGKCICPEDCRTWDHGLQSFQRPEPRRTTRKRGKPEAWSWTLGSLDSGSKKWLPESASQTFAI